MGAAVRAAKRLRAGAETRVAPDIIAEDNIVRAVPRIVGSVKAGSESGLRPVRVEVVAGETNLAVLDKRVLVAAVEIDAIREATPAREVP